LKLVCTLGGAGSVAPMRFKFEDGTGYSGLLAFTPPTTASRDSDSTHPLLLVTDTGHDAVHVVDVVGRTHAGYVASPGSIAGPRGVAATSSSGTVFVAVSAWKEEDSGDHVVVVYRGSGAVWEKVRVIGGGFGGPGSGGQLRRPYGLRFSKDGSAIIVTDRGNNRASMFRVGDGGLVRHVATGLSYPWDVEEVEGGWLVVCGSHRVEFVDCVGGAGGGGGRPSLGKAGGGSGSGDGELYHPTALAVVPGLGLVVRDSGNDRLQVFG
jgi:DNA-binding beta-propeller fold protein YncE